jgi:hypothetical protein
MTSNENHLEAAFSAWRENPVADPSGPHLTEADLIRLAAAGGLAEAAPEELKHLDRCPACMADWAAWRRAFAVAGEMENGELNESGPEAEEVCAYGMLEAAASQNPYTGPRLLESSCGRWRLEILPSREDRSRGMLVLSCRQPENGDAAVVVRDRSGREILSGPLKDNRLARLCDRLDELDLSLWTVIAK